MKIKHKFAFFFLTAILLALFFTLLPYTIKSAVNSPSGLIALQERDQMYMATLLMLVVVIPVLVLAFAICWRYRASNKDAEYDPNWHDDPLAEAIWWGFPALIIVLMCIGTWVSSNQLDPFKPLPSSQKPIRIQVVALQWKWLFLYPEEKIASLNFLQFPENTPLNFEITSDAPMNSFWIPALGGQIYAMPGMITKLHLQALESGEFRGSSANISGTGFASMHFIAKSSSQADYDQWIKSSSQSGHSLGLDEYLLLLQPSVTNDQIAYVLTEDNLFNQIVMKYMDPVVHQQNAERIKLLNNAGAQ